MTTSNLNYFLKSEFYQKEDQVQVDLTYTAPNSSDINFKTVSLESFINFIKSVSTSETVLHDSELLTGNLVRKVETVSATHYFFYFEEISSTFLAESPFDYHEFYGKNVIPYFESKRPRITYPHVLFYFSFNKITKHSSYQLYFVQPQKDPFGFIQPLSYDTTIYANFLPNDMGHSFCWGSRSNITEATINAAAKENDLTYIRSLPFMYFNSKFNQDLFFSKYSGSFSILSQNYVNRSAFVQALSSVLNKYYNDEDKVTKMIQKLTELNHYDLFKALLPLLMNEKDLLPHFFDYLKSCIRSPTSPYIITFGKFCNTRGL